MAPRDIRSSFAAASAVGVIDVDLAEKLAPSAGLRNVLVHVYAVPLAEDLYGEYVRQVAGWLTDRD